MFAVLKAPFQILGGKILYCKLDDVVAIANTFVILHNITAHMQQNGDFLEKSDGEKRITKLLQDDEKARNLATIEYEENRRLIQSEVRTD